MCKDSVVAMTTESFSKVAAKSSAGQCMASVLLSALCERRLTVGLPAAVRHLSAKGEALFVVTCGAPPGDSATHMLDVLLRAFCIEHDIHVLEVDSERKLKRLLGVECSSSVGCVVVHSPYADPFSDSAAAPLSPNERSLVSLCEERSAPPLVRLPDK